MEGVKTENVISREKSQGKRVFDLRYLSDMMGGKKNLIREIIDAFLKQSPLNLSEINAAVEKSDYKKIKSLAHTMKSSVSIMGISVIAPVLHDMEELARRERDMEKIKQLNDELNSIVTQAVKEIEKEEKNYI